MSTRHPVTDRDRLRNRRQMREAGLKFKGADWFSDAYHFFLLSRWWVLLSFLGTCYILANVVFALLYLMKSGSIANARPHAFADAFYFSIQTFATIGYGEMRPHGVYGNLLASGEAFVGLLSFALASGLMFAKFSRPTAKVIFSERAVIAPRDGVMSLIFRMANGRTSQILEAQLRVVLGRTERTKEGEITRRLYDLELVRERSPVFALTWTAVHPINERSPLHHATRESLALVNGEVYITFIGIDDTFSQTVHARHTYRISDVDWKHRLLDVLSWKEDGSTEINYKNFHLTVPL